MMTTKVLMSLRIASQVTLFKSQCGKSVSSLIASLKSLEKKSLLYKNGFYEFFDTFFFLRDFDFGEKCPL